MNALSVRGLVVWLGAAGLCALAAAHAHRIHFALGRPAVFTGWLLFGLMVLLAAFNARKRLSMLPLGSASTWLLVHVAGGVLAVALFWLHTGNVWPMGRYEQALALLFYLLSLNGLAGYGLQRIYPRRLTQTGVEIIYERIPAELAAIRQRAQAVILECTERTKSDTLANHYLQTLEWFFCRPRFFSSHMFGGQQGRQWVRHQCASVQRYLNAAERGYLDQLTSLAQLKDKVDVHYTLQRIMKSWLLIHIPLAVAVMTLILWHIVVVHVYAL